MKRTRACGARSACKQHCFAWFLAVAAAAPRLAHAQTSPPEAATAEEPAQAPKPAPYSLPFALRPAAAATVLRLDTGFAFYEDPTSKNSGSTIAPVLTGSYKLTPYLAPLVRLGVVQNSPPKNAMGVTPDSGFGLLNPLVGATFAVNPVAPIKLAFFLGVTLPLGSGGGDHPDLGQKTARSVGIYARSAMDNSLFAVNDLAVIPGFDIAYVAHGFTVQAEATLFQLTRVRGSVDQKDAHRTNFTTGLHVGYFFVPFLSAGVELRHQRWLSTPSNVAADTTDSLRDTTTFAFGPRFHFQLAPGVWFRPAVALALPLDDPMKKSSYKVAQLDLPFSF